MNPIIDYLVSKFKELGHSDEDSKALAVKAAESPDLVPSSENDEGPSSFDVATSDNTVTQNGAVPRSTDQPFQMSGGPPAPLPPITPPAEQPPAEAPALTPAAPPNAAAPAPSPVAPTKSSATPSSTPENSGPSDEDRRQQGLAAAYKQKKLMALPGLAGGIADAIGMGASAFGTKGASGTQERIGETANKDFEQNKAMIEDKIKNDPQSDISKSYRQMVTQIAPDMAKQPAFQNMTANMIGEKLPLIDTMMKAKASEDARKMAIAQMQSNKDISLGLRQDQQQDKLEQNAKQMVSNLRGDKSLARAEEQRDAAIVAVNRLKEVQASGKGLNPIDYTDILGQIYKARTGTAPGEQVMNDIRQATAKGSFDKAYTYVTGQQAPATTQAITASLMNMAKSMGQQADKFHEGYMNAHLIKPSGLEDERWQPIVKTGRGMTFAEATQTPTKGTAITPEDQQAIDWAKSNPTDPRAAKILALHGQ